jgi:hypothetical protein
LWPEFSELDHALQVYLHEATLRVIRREVYSTRARARKFLRLCRRTDGRDQATTRIGEAKPMFQGKSSAIRRWPAMRPLVGRHVIRVFQLTSRCYDSFNAGSSTSVGGAAWPTTARQSDEHRLCTS